MTDFLVGEADDVLAPMGTVHRLDVGLSKVPRLRSRNGVHVPSEAPGDLDAAAKVGAAPALAVSGWLLIRRYLQTAVPLLASDVMMMVAAGALAMAAEIALNVLLPPHAHLPMVTASHGLALLPLLFAYWYQGLYPGIGLHPVIELRQVIKINTTAFLAVMATLSITGALHEWGGFFSVAWIMSLCAVPLGRTLTRRFSARGAWWGYPTVVISSGRAAATTVNALLNRPQSGLRPCGVIDPEGRSIGSVFGVPYLSHSQGVHATAATYAVVALPEVPRAALAGVLEVYRTRFPHLLLLSNVAGPSLWRDPRDCGAGLAGIELRNKLLLPWSKFIKRAVDVALTSMAIIIGMPLFVAIALAVKFSSRGPVFFGHTRLGRNQSRFKAWKFRTMRPDARAILQELLDRDPAARAEWEMDHKLRNDPRVTRVGQWLRKTSLDELPQLWNVLTGDMSLVGPRPIVDEEIIRYGEIYRLYSEVPPGITGLWQVSGRNNTTYPERIRLDEFYVRNWSPWLDLHILVRTIKTIIRREGAY